MCKTFPASLDQLYEMLRYIREQAALIGFEKPRILKIELAAEEALVNIISYGYPEKSGDIHIHCSNPEKVGLKIIIKDHGIPFNPLLHASNFNRNPVFDLESKIGGYGIFFIFKLMDEVNYIRDNGINILTLIKYMNELSG